jgi:hypothetical protein
MADQPLIDRVNRHALNARISVEVPDRPCSSVQPIVSEVEVDRVANLGGEGGGVELQGNAPGLAVGVEEWRGTMASVEFVLSKSWCYETLFLGNSDNLGLRLNRREVSSVSIQS